MSGILFKKKIRLLVLLKSNHKNEKKFYEKNKMINFKFLNRKSEFSSYNYLDKYNYFVGTENTLTHEALSKQKRVAVFARKKMLSRINKKINNELNFYWPGKMNKNGNYWTHDIDKKFIKIINFVLDA